MLRRIFVPDRRRIVSLRGGGYLAVDGSPEIFDWRRSVWGEKISSLVSKLRGLIADCSSEKP